MARLLRLVGLLLYGMLVPGMLWAEDRASVVGHWASENSIFEVELVHNTLVGEVRALLNPTYLPDEDGARVGESRTDDNNPDLEKRSQPIIGLSMFTEYAFESGQWQGKIYDPESGNTYQSRMKINKRGDLEIRGYIGMPMFGRTATFAPIERCTPEIRLMLSQLDGAHACP